MISLAELFASEETLHNMALTSGYNLLLATQWQSKFAYQLRTYISYIHQMYQKVRFFSPLASHDCGSVAEEYGSERSIYTRYVISSLFATGNTGLVQGNEFGTRKKIEFIGKPGIYSWNKDPDDSEFIRKINRLLDEHMVFSEGANLRFIDNNHQAILGALRTDSNGGKYFLFVNLDIEKEQLLKIDLSNVFERSIENIELANLLGNGVEKFKPKEFELSIKPCDIRIYKLLE